jgi:hypothetical protein
MSFIAEYITYLSWKKSVLHFVLAVFELQGHLRQLNLKLAEAETKKRTTC